MLHARKNKHKPLKGYNFKMPRARVTVLSKSYGFCAMHLYSLSVTFILSLIGIYVILYTPNKQNLHKTTRGIT